MTVPTEQTVTAEEAIGIAHATNRPSQLFCLPVVDEMGWHLDLLRIHYIYQPHAM